MPKPKRLNSKTRANIRCKCGGHSHVIDSRRYTHLGNNTRRRRECLRCGTFFTTIEMTVDEYNEFVEAWNRLCELREEIATSLTA